MSHFAKSTAVFSGLTMVSRVTGLLRLMAFTFAMGVQTQLADAYNLAHIIPSIIYEFMIGGLLSAIFIPLLVREQEQSGKTSAEAWRVANLLMGGVGLVLAVASTLAIVLSPYIIQALTFFNQRQGSSADKELAAWFLKFFAPQMLFYGLSSVFMAILNSHSVFAITAAAPIINNLVVIVTLIAYRFGMIGPMGLAIGTTAGIAAMALVQVPWLIKVGMPLRPRFTFRDPVFRSVAALGAPIIIVAVANLVNTAVRTNLLSTVRGGFTAYVICFQLIMMPYGIFAVSIATVLYPALSRAATEKSRTNFVNTLSLGLRWTTFIMLPMAVGLAVLALPVMRALFEHRGGEFRYADSVFTADFLRYYALSILPYSLVMFATRAFYSVKDTVTPAWINVVGVVVNAAVAYWLLPRMGIAGVALAAVICYVLTTAISAMVLRRDVGALDGPRLWGMAWRAGTAAALMAVAVLAVERYTRPDVAVLQRGARFNLRVPESATSGTALLVRNDGDWQKLQREMQLTPASVPPVDFTRESILLLIGPQSATTSSLELVGSDTKSGTASFRAAVRAGRQAATSGADAPTSPSYLLAKVERAVQSVDAAFEVHEPGARREGMAASFTGEILRLVLLVLLGAAVYGITTLLLGSDEPKTLLTRLRKKVGRE